MIESILAWYLEHLDYWVVTLLMIIESSFIPFPSEVVIPPAAYLAATGGELNIVLVVLFATLGADIGALINYYLALYLGRPVIYAFARSKVGKFLLLSPEKIQKAEEYFVKKGAVSTLVGRLLPAVRQLISIPAGLAKMKLGPFLLYTTLGALSWNIVLALLGYVVAQIPGVDTPQKAIELVSRYSHEIGYALLAIVALFVLWQVVKNVLKRKKTQKDKDEDQDKSTY